MIFAKKNPIQEIEAQLAAIVRRQERRASELTRAQLELNAANEALRRLLTESDDDEPKAKLAAQKRVEAAKSALEPLIDACDELGAQRAAAEQRLSTESERLERVASADKIERQLKEFETALGVIEGLKVLGAAGEQLGDICFDLGAIGKYATAAAAEIELAGAFAINDARMIVGAVLRGERPIPKRPSEIPPPPPPPPPEPFQEVFLRDPIAWTDSSGQVKLAPALYDIRLPPAVAAAALECGAAIPRNHSDAAKMRPFAPGYAVPLITKPGLKCLDAAAAAVRAAAERAEAAKFGAVQHSAKAPFDLGESPHLSAPFTIYTPAGNAQPEPEQIARSWDPDQ